MNTQSNLTKQSLRKLILEQRNALSEKQQQALSQQICNQLITLKQIQQAKTIALYFSHKNEVDVTPLMQQLNNNITWVFPVVLPDKHLVFHPHTEGDTLTKNKYGIPEPTQQHHPVALNEIDVILQPALGFDCEHNRLGTGAGYYDRTLESLHPHIHLKPFLIVAAYEFQKINHIPADPWDVAADCAVTEKQTYFME